MQPGKSAATETEQSHDFLAGKAIHEDWKADYLGNDLEPFYDEAMATIVRQLGARPGDTILDAGCGYCFHAARLAKLGLKVTGVDFSAAALEEARTFLGQKGLANAVTLREGNLLDLPFPDDSFQFVSCWGVLMHVPEVEKALAQLVRVVRPGGRISLMENNRNSLHVRVWEPSLRLLKRLIGRKQPKVRFGPSGKEEWHEADAQRGGLLVRKTDMSWLQQTMRRLGAELRHRQAGQFTEIYSSLPTRFVKRLVHAFNRFWFRHAKVAWPAMGNILIFEKVAPPRQ